MRDICQRHAVVVPVINAIDPSAGSHVTKQQTLCFVVFHSGAGVAHAGVSDLVRCAVPAVVARNLLALLY